MVFTSLHVGLVTRGWLFDALSCAGFTLDVDEDGGVVIPTTVEWLWHRRLGHPGYDAMFKLVNNSMVDACPSASSK
jgi:hypothetical protein